MKQKIEYGQCFEKNDKIYMAEHLSVGWDKTRYWVVQNTLTKERSTILEKDLLTYRRPFQNHDG